MRAIVLHTDGYADERDAGWAFLASGELTHQASGRLPPTPSHLVEWTAVEEALAWLEREAAQGDAVELRVDSALVAKGLASRRPEMSGEAAHVRARCRQALARLGARGVSVRVVRIPRDENREADGLARAAAHRDP